MKEFKSMDEAIGFWEKRGGSTVKSKHEYQSRRNKKKTIYTKHGPEYIPAIIGTIRKYEPKVFIELGTFMGGLTLAIHEEFPDMTIWTFDHIDNLGENRSLFYNNVNFVIGDVLAGENSYLVYLLEFTKEKKILYCDNGNKEYEINTYAKYLLPGNVLGCHDWLAEIDPLKVEKTLMEFTPFDRTTYLNNKSTIFSRFWMKR